MPNISIPFTFNPNTHEVYIELPLDVTNPTSGTTKLTIPYTINSEIGQPDVFIPVNVSGKTLSVPVDLGNPTVNIPLIGIVNNYSILPYNNGTSSGTGEITVWWENNPYPETPSEPPIIVDPINPEEPKIIVDDFVVPPEEIPHIDLPFESVGGNEFAVFPMAVDDDVFWNDTKKLKNIDNPIPAVEITSNKKTNSSGGPDILQVLLNQASPTNLNLIKLPIITNPTTEEPEISIPFTVDTNSPENRILVPYSSATDNQGTTTISVGQQQDQIQPQPSSVDVQTTKNALNNSINATINDISTISNAISNPLSVLEGGISSISRDATNGYDFSSLSYPEDVQSTAFYGHYVNFFINVHQASKYYNGCGIYSYQNSPGGGRSYAGTGATSPGGISPNEGAGLSGLIQNATYKRITQAISLYIPDSMNYQQAIQWENASVMEMGMKLVKGLGGDGSSKSATDGVSKGRMMNSLKNLAGALGGATETAGNLGAIAGFAMNPQLLVLFRGIEFRSFQYEFYFTPKNESEAKSVRDIVKTFRFHAHPETMLGEGVFYIAPSTFDIEFMHKGKLNENIHKVKTCVLKNYNVDYAPFGWATYVDGMPIQTRLTLQFQEVEVITKEQIEKGY